MGILFYNTGIMPVDVSSEQAVGLNTVDKLVTEIYIPLTEVERMILWPNGERQENDSEHSYSLALIGAALAERLGLDPAKVSLYAVFHDVKERWALDTPVFDPILNGTKHEREQAALAHIEINFQETPIIASVIRAYEEQVDEEAVFVYALDKLLATYMIFLEGGSVWKSHGYTYEIYMQKAAELRQKVAAHPVVLEWYDQLMTLVAEKKGALFLPKPALAD